MESGFYIYAIYRQWVTDICLAPSLAVVELCITSWHEHVTFSQDDDDDNDITAWYESNTLSLTH
jgi:hypothetical protein